MERVHDAIAWYQKKIGSYDKHLWEQSVESKIIKSFKHVPKRSVRVKTELIDVDLVRGSTFSKAKPEVSWTHVTKKALTRVVFFPLCSRWWIQQTSVKVWLLMLVLYLIQLSAVLIFFRNVGGSITQDELILSEAIIPVAIMFILGLIHSQTVLSHISHRGHRDKSGRDSKGRRFYRSFSVPSCPVSSTNDVASNQDADNSITDKQEEGRQSNKDTQLSDGKNRLRKKKPFGQGKSVSWSDVYSRHAPGGRDKSSVESDDSDRSQQKNKPQANGVLKYPDIVRRLDTKKTPQILNHHRGSGSFESDILTEEEEDVLVKVSANCSLNRGVEVVDTNNVENVDKVSDNFEILSIDRSVNGVKSDHDSSTQSPTSDQLKLPIGEGKIILPENGKLVLTNNVEVPLEPCDATEVTSHVLNTNVRNGEVFRQCSGTDISTSDSLNALAPDSMNKEFVGNGEISVMKRCKVENEICPKKKESETDTDRDDSDNEIKTFQGLRRRKHQQDDSSESGASYYRSRRVPNTSRKDKETSSVEMKNVESSILMADEENKDQATVSSEEWEDRVQSDVSTSSYSSSSESEAGINEQDVAQISEDASAVPTTSSSSQGERTPASNPHPSSTTGASHTSPPDKVSCMIWEGSECKKVELTALDIGWTIIEKVDNIPESSDYILIGLVFSLILGLVPVMFRIYHCKDLDVESLNLSVPFMNLIEANTWRENFILCNGILQRLCLSTIFFFLLSVADRTFKQRLLYAKHFCYLTSSRRAKKFDMPHFRLNKVRNIKIWLSLRSYLKKRGPQRSVDVIVSAAFILSIILLTLMCLQLLKDTDKFLDFLCNWELMVWCLALGIYLMHYMTLGLKINKKYRNLSVLITEQINLYLQMEQKPHKKEELMVANNVLKLAEDLLKELESPFKISGVSANPVLYNIIKVVVLSAFSAVLTELLGFKLKLYKIKLKA